ncbi:hypothetical protein M2101_001386 [Parabacteroides sp. PM5-20]|uniref:thiol protease/hemagglutinin PrtT n=1 Tax=unclassified Parabacteroides TaxID=2649774 RepID=UPI0013D7D2E0|nr:MULTISPECIES: thiol protease/hemagglutinin PrtT [unclassified Parabacteroides]MDH6534710.1 hypothetical protein [Parabacteroides sp. PM5-20]
MSHSKLSPENSFVVLLITFFFIGAPLSAEKVNRQTAHTVATHFVQASSALRAGAALELVYAGSQLATKAVLPEETAPFYVYNVTGAGGFVIVSGQDAACPILGYADQGQFQAEDMPPNLRDWLLTYEEEIAFIQEKGIEATSDVVREWNDLLQGNVRRSAGDAYILTTARWDQEAPYNDLCPVDGTTRSAAGCMATAMGIAMHYHKWPKQGSGSNSYVSKDKKFNLSQSFEVPYAWDRMLHAYTYANENKNGTSYRVPTWSAEEGKAVATLIYHAGVAVNMNYSAASSGATSLDCQKALITHFGYDNATYLVYRNLYTADAWNALIRNELDEERVVLYAGQSKYGGGHQFVIDGYMANNYFHVNWGWSGISEGFFLLSALDPGAEGVGGAKDGAGYSYNQDAVIGMQKAIPGTAPVYELFFMDYDGRNVDLKDRPVVYGLYTDVSHIVQGEPFLFYYSYVCNYGFHPADLSLGIFHLNKKGEIKDQLEVMTMQLRGGYLTWENEGIPLVVTQEVEEGDYLQMYYRVDQEDWRVLRYEPGFVDRLDLYKKNPVGNQSIESAAEWALSFTQTPDALCVHAPEGVSMNRLTLFDIAGCVLADQHFPGSSQATLSLYGQKAGLYIVSVRTNKGICRQKIIRK